MSKRLILARHGNTFKPEDEPVWVGARTDMPLVEKGLLQAKQLGDALQKTGILIGKIVTGPLQRTRQTASIAAETLNLPPTAVTVDQRLTEIDYGAWEGKSTPAIIAMGGEAELAAWNKQSIYPCEPNWQPAEAQIVADINTLIAQAEEGTTLIVTSNGILRFFARAAENADAYPDRKVATGHVCVLENTENGSWKILQWNQPPHLLNV